MFLSELKGKKVISLSTAATLGTVDGVYIDRNEYKVKYISLLGDMRILPVEKLYASKDILVAADINESEYENTIENMLIYRNGADIYDVNGNYVGKSVDIEIDSKKKSPVFLSDDKAIKLAKIVAAGDEVILINPKLKPLLPCRSDANALVPKTIEGEKTETVGEIREADNSDYGFLIGRKLNREVADISRSFVLMAGTLITERVIANARRAGKIADLVTKSE